MVLSKKYAFGHGVHEQFSQAQQTELPLAEQYSSSATGIWKRLKIFLPLSDTFASCTPQLPTTPRLVSRGSLDLDDFLLSIEARFALIRAKFVQPRTVKGYALL
jgi:hypothetical protein